MTIGGHEEVRPILTAPNKSLPSGLKLHQKKQWRDKEIVLVAMVGQANHCIQQHVALAQLPLGAHRGVPDDGAFIKNVANVGKKGSRRPLERIYPFWLGCPSPISSGRC